MADSRTTLTQPGRIIFGLMVATVAFSIVGAEIDQNQNTKPVLSPFKVIFGGTVATSLLVLISHAGEAGEQFATGLAVIAATSAMLVYGKPVWQAISGQFGSSPTLPTGTPHKPGETGYGAAIVPVNQSTGVAQ